MFEKHFCIVSCFSLSLTYCDLLLREYLIMPSPFFDCRFFFMPLAGGEHRMFFSETTPGFSDKAEDMSDERSEEFRKPRKTKETSVKKNIKVLTGRKGMQKRLTAEWTFWFGLCLN